MDPRTAHATKSAVVAAGRREAGNVAAHSLHSSETILLDEQRCRVTDNASRELDDGDEIYPLAPVTGG